MSQCDVFISIGSAAEKGSHRAILSGGCRIARTSKLIFCGLYPHLLHHSGIQTSGPWGGISVS
jgi:hypothetical protein